MSDEHTDMMTSVVDDRSDDVPEGGFVPIGDLDDSHEAATMPPPPGGSSVRLDGSSTDHAAWVDAGFPPAAATEAAVEAVTPEALEAVPVADAAADDGFVLFGEGSERPSSGPWAVDDDADLILPIEPARLSPWGAATPTQGSPSRESELAGEQADAPDDPVVTNAAGPDVDGIDVPDSNTVVALVTGRLGRILSPLVARLSAFLGDDATHFSTGWLPGTTIGLAGSELVGVLDGPPADTFGASVELGAPHHIPMGIRIPIDLVDKTSNVTSLGGIGITAVSGTLEIAPTFGPRVVDDVAVELTILLGRFSDAAELLLEEHRVLLSEITLDAAGAIRIEVERY
jgi:hypothetical protein